MKTIIFWGTGKIGKQMLDLWEIFGKQPDFYADNCEERWGSLVGGIRVLSIEEVRDCENAQILITCNQVDQIRLQLLESGLPQEAVFKGNTIMDMLDYLAVHMMEKGREGDDVRKVGCAPGNSEEILLDVQSGFVLGGVEAWALQMGDILSRQGYDVKFLTTDLEGWKKQEDDDKTIQMRLKQDSSEVGRLAKCLEEIKKNRPCHVVCDFPFYIFQAACIAKILWPLDINLIAVVHSDVEVYYERYSQMKELLDYCVVTCDYMEARFLKAGMNRHKIVRMAWEIPCKEVLERTYSEAGEPIRIGYAGRIVIGQKRMDLLVEILRKLEKAGIDFHMEIAGEGEYREEMEQALQKISDKVCFRGQIAGTHIADFWERQDIGINCSDYEGRCISKAESMAAGAVPVITDTSSAGDDVQDGYNGFVVSVGDADGIADKICYLYYHRELLSQMGERSHQIILEQNKKNDIMGMWNSMMDC